MTLHPSLGQIGAQALHIDIITVKAHLGTAHQGITFEPRVAILIVAHIIACQHIGLSFQALGNNHGSQVGGDGHFAVILVVPAQLVGMGILENVADLVLIQDEDVGTLIIIKHCIDELIPIVQRRDRIEVEVVTIIRAVVLDGEGDLSMVFIEFTLDPSLGQIDTESLQIHVIAIKADLQHTVHNFPTRAVKDVGIHAVTAGLHIGRRCNSCILQLRCSVSQRGREISTGHGHGVARLALVGLGQLDVLHSMCTHRHRQDGDNEQKQILFHKHVRLKC